MYIYSIDNAMMPRVSNPLRLAQQDEARGRASSFEPRRPLPSHLRERLLLARGSFFFPLSDQQEITLNAKPPPKPKKWIINQHISHPHPEFSTIEREKRASIFRYTQYIYIKVPIAGIAFKEKKIFLFFFWPGFGPARTYIHTYICVHKDQKSSYPPFF